jgi:hypothetical protein
VITARFAGGPRDGQELQLDIAEPSLYVEFPSSIGVGLVRYALHFTDRKGVAHYYVPNVLDANSRRLRPNSRKG